MTTDGKNFYVRILCVWHAYTRKTDTNTHKEKWTSIRWWRTHSNQTEGIGWNRISAHMRCDDWIEKLTKASSPSPFHRINQSISQGIAYNTVISSPFRSTICFTTYIHQKTPCTFVRTYRHTQDMYAKILLTSRLFCWRPFKICNRAFQRHLATQKLQ